MAAAGAKVVSFDLSEEQLKKDCDVAKRDRLQIRSVQGDMASLCEFADESFDLIFHPISNVFVPDVTTVWSECHRILKNGGDLLAGVMNPSFFLFDHEEAEKCGELIVKRKLPFSEPHDLNNSQRTQWEANKNPAQFSHSLNTQIDGQIAAGFAIIGFYEDSWSDEATLLNRFSPTSIATGARKL
ncbi:MAG: class I SAM-dependent methyltransferase [Atribacterota bacterium]|nr:class I SAM-dependent methyltransferase [Atribacterota bacterium]MDD4896197.1 class I SAM-dependent methyltransferase [Atribacterota bacterium]MDD5637940.1 class I SAM-dependent methyltransferase [Atribacterota bacterium]